MSLLTLISMAPMVVWCAYPACIFATCIEALRQVCGIRPKHPPYPTCGLTCAAKLKASSGSYYTLVLGSTRSPSYLGGSNNSDGSSYSSGITGLLENLTLDRNSGSTASSTSTASSVLTKKPGMCVVSLTRLRYAITYFLLCILNFYRFVALSQAIPREENITPRVVLAVGTR